MDEILMAKDKSLISVYVPDEVKERLEKWAGEEDRSVSYIVGRLIADALDIRDKQTRPAPAAVPQPQQQVTAQPESEPATEQPVVRSRRSRQPRREPKNS